MKILDCTSAFLHFSPDSSPTGESCRSSSIWLPSSTTLCAPRIVQMLILPFKIPHLNADHQRHKTPFLPLQSSFWPCRRCSSPGIWWTNFIIAVLCRWNLVSPIQSYKYWIKLQAGPMCMLDPRVSHSCHTNLDALSNTEVYYGAHFLPNIG